MADQVAGNQIPLDTPNLYQADAEAAHNALIPHGTLTWRTAHGIFKDSLQHHAQRHNFRNYVANTVYN